MTDEEKMFIAERFGNVKGTNKELEEYKNLSDDLREVYRRGYKRNSEWSHEQTMLYVARIAADWKQWMRHNSMRGVGFDIANSSQLNEKQKKELIRACENYFYNDVPFNKYHKSLLYKIRKEYHIVLTGLSEMAKPKGLLDVLLGL